MNYSRPTWILIVVAIAVASAVAQPVPGPTSPSPRKNSNAALIQVTASDPSGIEIAVRTHATLMSHHGLVTRVLRIPDNRIRQTDWFKQMGEPAAASRWLQSHLLVEAVEGTALIRISLDQPAPAADSQAILDAVVSQYISEAQTAAQNRNMERIQSLNNLKVKYETRIRELMDRQNNRMLMLDVGQVGSPNRYTATDWELDALLKKRAELVAQGSAVATTQPSGSTATLDPKTATAALDARIDQISQKLGDLAIAMSDYLAITDELAATRSDLRSLKSQLDTLSAGMPNPPVAWAAHPVAPDDSD